MCRLTTYFLFCPSWANCLSAGLAELKLHIAHKGAWKDVARILSCCCCCFCLTGKEITSRHILLVSFLNSQDLEAPGLYGVVHPMSPSLVICHVLRWLLSSSSSLDSTENDCSPISADRFGFSSCFAQSSFATYRPPPPFQFRAASLLAGSSVSLPTDSVWHPPSSPCHRASETHTWMSLWAAIRAEVLP